MYTEPIEERCYAYVPNRETSTLAEMYSRGTLGAKRNGSISVVGRHPRWWSSGQRRSPRVPTTRPAGWPGHGRPQPQAPQAPSGVATAGQGRRILERGARPVGSYLALLWPPHGPVHATCVHQGGGGACAPVSPTQPQRPMKRARACAQQQPRHPARQSEKAGAQKRTGASGCRRVGSLASHSCRAFVLHLVPLRRGSE